MNVSYHPTPILCLITNQTKWSKARREVYDLISNWSEEERCGFLNQSETNRIAITVKNYKTNKIWTFRFVWVSLQKPPKFLMEN
jgi:hypothetical protein